MPLHYSMLIVEGNQELRDQLSRRFLTLGYDVVAVGHPRHALCAATVKSFHVALLDDALPETDAIALMQRLKRTIQGLRVVLLSSNDQREAAVNALASGAFDCVMKPLRISELERVVEEAVEHTDETVRIAETANTEDTVVMTRDEYVEMAKD